MCDHHHHSARAISLEHGADHDHDHATWTRRDFLVRAGLGGAAAATAPAWVGKTEARALTGSPHLDALSATETDRVLVLVQLQGGNDGLNTIIPVQNDLYYNARPTLSIAPRDSHPLSAEFGMHPQMGALAPAWASGDMAVVHSVGYPDSSLSHFKGTDIWLSADEDVRSTGWMGRALATEYPNPQDNPPEAPPAVQMGTSAPLLFNGPEGGLSMALLDVELFLQIAEGGEIYSTSDVPPGAPGDELAFVRSVANDAFRYRDRIQAATAAADNQVTYPDTRFAEELAAIARLIKGRLGSRIYLVSLGSFDTHANQPDRHAALLDQLSGALVSFYADLAASGDAERTLAVTFSEFGRRVAENGSDGTDHGTSAPLFLFGPQAVGGLYGSGPDLSALDSTGNMSHEIDFRQIYASLLRHWFGMDAGTTANILGGDYEALALIDTPTTNSAASPEASGVVLDAPAPNPIRSRSTVTYYLPAPGDIILSAYDTAGREVAVLASGSHAAGAHTVAFDASALSSGVYVLRLQTASGVATQRATVVR